MHVPFERVDKKTNEPKSRLEIAIEKKSMVNLVNAYSVSVKVRLTRRVRVRFPQVLTLVLSICSAENRVCTTRTSTLL